MAKCVCHPAEDTVTNCWKCDRGICDRCIRASGRSRCLDCSRSHRRSRLISVVALTVLGACLAAVAAWRIAIEVKNSRYGAHAARILELQDQLQKEPCDASAAIEVAELLIAAGTSREVAPLAAAFRTRCGRQEQLLWKEYGAAKRTGNWERALTVATDLIEHDPADKDYWWWRGIVYEQREELDKALADYKQTLAIRPDIDAIPFNVADVYERLKRPCDAALAIEQFLYWHPRSQDEQGLQLRLQRLYRQGRCEEAARGTAELRFAPGSRAIFVSAMVNGKRGRFVVDTGASLVTLSREFAEQARVAVPAGPPIRVSTANGAALARLARLDSLALKGAVADGVEAAVSDGLPEDIDGLLGLSFLARFDFHLDAEEGRLELAAKHHQQ